MSRRPADTDVFSVIADPTRRAILDMLRESEMTVSEIVQRFPMTQSAVSQHLRLLREAGLVATRREGREIHYGLTAQGLKPVADWVERYEAFWRGKLEALGRALDALPDDPDDVP